MKILLSWSSGKDSAWALHVLNQQYPGAVAGLLTTVNEAVDRVAMHAVRREVLEAQAAAAGLPLVVVPIPHPCSNDEYETRMGIAVASAVRSGFTHVAFGDLFLEDVRKYREERLAGSGLQPLFEVGLAPLAQAGHRPRPHLALPGPDHAVRGLLGIDAHAAQVMARDGIDAIESIRLNLHEGGILLFCTAASSFPLASPRVRQEYFVEAHRQVQQARQRLL